MSEKYGGKVRKLMVKETKETFTSSNGFIIASMENVKATEIDAFRKEIRQAGSKYFVIKNRLANIALEEAGIEGLTETVKQQSVLGVGVIQDDPVQIARMLVDFSKKKKGFNVAQGYLEGRVLSAERVKELAEMPSREQLIAMIVGMINAPISNFVGVLGSILSSLARVVNAIKEKKEKE